MYWQDARAYCEEKNSHLIKIEDEQENRVATQAAASNGGSKAGITI